MYKNYQVISGHDKIDSHAFGRGEKSSLEPLKNIFLNH
jgi:hypothetical protein